VGIEPPKWHDVGPVLRKHVDRFPDWFRKQIGQFTLISRLLCHEREPSMYGDEELGIPPDQIYWREDAEWALSQAEYVVEEVRKLCS